MDGRFFSGNGSVENVLIRVIKRGLDKAWRRRCGWDLEGFNGWEIFNDGRRWKMSNKWSTWNGDDSYRRCERNDGCGRWKSFIISYFEWWI